MNLIDSVQAIYLESEVESGVHSDVLYDAEGTHLESLISVFSLEVTVDQYVKRITDNPNAKL